MTGVTPYLFFAGTARNALSFYREVFGGELELHTFAEFGRQDGPPDSIAHGALAGPVPLFAADGLDGEAGRRMDGMVFALLGVAEPATMAGWFDRLAEGGEVVAPLEQRAWGDHDGRVADRYGISWLLGYAG